MTTPGAAPDVRHRAREAALQMLYQWEASGSELEDVVDAYRHIRPHSLTEPGEALAGRLVRGTVRRLGEIDPRLEARSEHWRLERMSMVDRLILRMAVFELLEMPETPRSVVINEALELARTFSTEAAVKFINGVLDGVGREIADERGRTDAPIDP